MLPPDTIAEIEGYWVAHLGCPQERLFDARVVTLPHSAFKGYQGLFLVRRGGSCMIAAPPELMDLVHSCVQDRPVSEVFGSGLWRDLLPDVIERVVGPAVMTYADASTLRAVESPGTMPLDDDDRHALERLAEACGTEDWDRSGLGPSMPALVGHWIGGELVAVAGYEAWGERIANVGVATHPAHRGQGHGKAVVSALAQLAIEEGLAVQLRALARNHAALGIARALGFEEYAQTLAIGLNVPRIRECLESDRRLREAPPTPDEALDEALGEALECALDGALDETLGDAGLDDDDGRPDPTEPRD
jgi:GNAT superfamily N-acetyltransferase